MKVRALVDRDTGKARTVVIDNVNASTLMPIMPDTVAREACVVADEHSGYHTLKDHFAAEFEFRYTAVKPMVSMTALARYEALRHRRASYLCNTSETYK